MSVTNAKLGVLSDALQDMGQVFFASILVEPVVSNNANVSLIFAGLSLSVLCWTLRLPIAKKYHD